MLSKTTLTFLFYKSQKFKDFSTNYQVREYSRIFYLKLSCSSIFKDTMSFKIVATLKTYVRKLSFNIDKKNLISIHSEFVKRLQVLWQY